MKFYIKVSQHKRKKIAGLLKNICVVSIVTYFIAGVVGGPSSVILWL